METMVLRYGCLYGEENPATQHLFSMLRKRAIPLVKGAEGLAPFIHMKDAVSATVAALEHGGGAGGSGGRGAVYNIADDKPLSFNDFIRTAAQSTHAPRPFSFPAWAVRLFAPLLVTMAESQLSLSNERAKRELQWSPQFPSCAEGLKVAAQALSKRDILASSKGAVV